MKQSVMIKNYLLERMGTEKGYPVYQDQQKIYEKLVDESKSYTKNQKKTLESTILPRIALYKAFQKNAEYSDDAYEIVKDYMFQVVGKAKHDSMANMEKVPFFYFLFSHIFIHIMKVTDLQKSRLSKKKNSFNIDITKCLWHDACVKNECPELCRCFCEVDDITYGNLQKVGFSRTQTLGCGGSVCDFHFYKK